MKDKPTWLKNLFPWEQKTIHVNGRLMAYVDEGDADVPACVAPAWESDVGLPLP